MKNQILHTPEGVRDIINGEYLRKRKMIEVLMENFYSFGYQPIETPTLEYFDVFGKEVGTTPSRELYKLFDKDGETVVLRPDFTPGVARAASKCFSENEALKLCYEGHVFVNSDSYKGNLKESTQLGAEFINDPSLEADAEMIAMAGSVMEKSGLEDFQISIGHADIFKGLCQAAGLTDETDEDTIKNLISNKNFFGAVEFLEEKNVSKEVMELFAILFKLYQAPDEWADILPITEKYPLIHSALMHLKDLNEVLKKYDAEKYITFELGLLSPYKYYTGILFNGYTFGNGESVIRGGRYDKLMKYFRSDAPAIGFAVMLDSLLNALSRQKEESKSSEKGYLTVALGKGRLAEKAMDYFEKIGISCEEMKDKKSRKLIFTNEEKKIRFFLAKGPDVPTYVEYGAADIGIVGEDTILEEGRNIYEVLDLKFGKCRMCICGPKEA
ncbi:MAG: ATP phosphoribosyltransferase, partial [Lachnospiraceae bacterium]|nr:ATP phosphoribosyltransferase [Lachnospiraceae bacterium]